MKWYDDAMRTTIDKAGRVVIPKPIREALGLDAGTELDIEIDGVAIRLEGVASGQACLKEVDGLLVIARDEGTPIVTVDDVRKMRFDSQR